MSPVLSLLERTAWHLPGTKETALSSDKLVRYGNSEIGQLMKCGHSARILCSLEGKEKSKVSPVLN
jgi:hypothetical protein